MSGAGVVETWSSTQATIAASSGKAEHHASMKAAPDGLGLQSSGVDLGWRMQVRLRDQGSANPVAVPTKPRSASEVGPVLHSMGGVLARRSGRRCVEALGPIWASDVAYAVSRKPCEGGWPTTESADRRLDSRRGCSERAILCRQPKSTLTCICTECFRLRQPCCGSKRVPHMRLCSAQCATTWKNNGPHTLRIALSHRRSRRAICCRLPF